eukprot:UN04934
MNFVQQVGSSFARFHLEVFAQAYSIHLSPNQQIPFDELHVRRSLRKQPSFYLELSLESEIRLALAEFQHFRSCDIQQLCPSLRSG